MKKKRIAVDQPLAVPQKIRKEALIAAMRRLLSSEDFALLESLWLGIRSGMLEQGKDKPSEAAWSVLKGFDAAVLEVRKWAYMQTLEDVHKKRAAELQASLAETSEGR